MTTLLEWMMNEIRSQIRVAGREISGLPEEVRESLINECIDILKRNAEPKAPPSLDKDGCVYWDHILERTDDNVSRQGN